MFQKKTFMIDINVKSAQNGMADINGERMQLSKK